MSTFDHQHNEENIPSDDQLTRNLEYTERRSPVDPVAPELDHEPAEGLEPVPLWLVLVFGVIIFWAGGYLTYYSGGFKSDIFDEEAAVPGTLAGSGGAKIVDPVAVGKRLFSANCAVCHQATGLGVPGQYPPLAGSEIVLGLKKSTGEGNYGPNHLVRILLSGLSGPIKIHGQTYNGNMPPWQAVLKDEQIAYILTYVRQEWGNGAPAISPDGVAAVRKEIAGRTDTWTEAELDAMPAAEISGPPPVPAVPGEVIKK